MAPENPIAAWKQIDRICDEFEAALRAGEPVRIADFLVADWPDELRRKLLVELLEVAFEHHERRGEQFDLNGDSRLSVADREFIERRLQQSELLRRPKHETSGSVRDSGARCFADYELLDEISRGGMGVVYRARHRSLDRTVALKVISSGGFASPEEVERFQAEARAAAALEHPHIVPVYDVGVEAEQHYFTMALVPGGDLNRKVAENLYEPRNAAATIEKLADAVDYAHQRGILHRDLKPANVLLDEHGEPRLTDFGLAKNLTADISQNLTQTGQLLGTPSFMAPEQAAGAHKQIDAATDVYALGAILYFMLTGRPPFRAAGITETLRQVVHDDPLSPRTITPQVDRDLETICLKCLSKQGGERYFSAAELRDDLRRYLAGEPIHARPLGVFVKSIRYCKKNVARVSLVAAGLLLLAAILVVAEYRRESKEAAERLGAANELADSRRQTAETAEFFGLLQQATTLKANHEPGWTWAVENLLTEANAKSSAVRDLTLIRETVIGPATSFDLRPLRTVADDLLPGSMAFSHDGRFFAVGESIDETRPRLLVFGTNDFDRPVLEFSFDSEAETQRRIARGDSKVDDGYRALAFSPDGRRLAAGTRFGRVLVYDLQQPAGDPITLDVLEDVQVDKLAFSHDDELLYALSSTRALKQWRDFRDEQILQGDIRDFAVDRTGRRLIVCRRQELEVYRELGPPILRTISDQIADGIGVNIMPDGQDVLAADHHEIVPIRLRGEMDDRLRFVDQTLADYVATSFFANNGQFLFSPARDWLRIWDLNTGTLLYRLAVGARHLPIISLDPAGQFLAVRSDGPAQLFELRRPTALRRLTGLPEAADSAAHLENRLVSSTEDLPVNRAMVKSWDVSTGRGLPALAILDHSNISVRPLSHASARHATQAISLAGVGLIVLDGDVDDSLPTFLSPLGRSLRLGQECLHLVETGEEQPDTILRTLATKPVSLEPASFPLRLRVELPLERIPEEWTRLAVCATIRMEAESNVGPAIAVGRLPKSQNDPNVGQPAQVTPRDRREFVGAERAVVFLQTATRQQFQRDFDAVLELAPKPSAITRLLIEDILVIPVPDLPNESQEPAFVIGRPTFDLTGDRIWGVVDGDRLCSWEIKGPGEPTRWEQVPEWLSRIYDIEVTDSAIYTASRNGAVQLTDPVTGQISSEIPISDDPVNNLDLGPEASWMIVSGDSGFVERRELPSGRLIESIADLGQPVTAQALSSTHDLLVTGDAAGHCVLWERKGNTFIRLVELAEFTNPVKHVAFSDDDRFLSVVVADQRAISLFDLQALNQQFARYDAATASLPGASRDEVDGPSAAAFPPD